MQRSTCAGAHIAWTRLLAVNVHVDLHRWDCAGCTLADVHTVMHTPIKIMTSDTNQKERLVVGIQCSGHFDSMHKAPFRFVVAVKWFKRAWLWKCKSAELQKTTLHTSYSPIPTLVARLRLRT
jgi:hypothetical protein